MKGILAFLITLMLLATPVLAMSTPMPVVVLVKVDSYPPYALTLTNIDSGESITGTSPSGEFIFDLNNMVEYVRVGDRLRLTVGSDSVEAVWPGDRLVMEIDKREPCSVCQICTDPTSCPDLTCADVPACPNMNCPDVTCPDCPDCPTTDDPIVPTGIPIEWAALFALITLGLGVGGGIYATKDTILHMGGGVKVYRKRDGTEVLYHKHRGIRGYHDPKRLHTKQPWEKHPTGELNPKYEKNPEEGDRYEYVGG